MQKYIVEFIGTFFLTLVAAMTGNPLAIGMMLAVMVYAGGSVSGAHYNPAVTIALALRGLVKQSAIVGYILAQLGGAVAATGAAFLLQGAQFMVLPNSQVGFATALLAEIIATFALVYTISYVATNKNTEGNSYFGFAIGMAVMALASAVGPVSGGALNPAIGVGSHIAWVFQKGFDVNAVVLYTVGPITGGILASIIYKTIESHVKKETHTHKS